MIDQIAVVVLVETLIVGLAVSGGMWSGVFAWLCMSIFHIRITQLTCFLFVSVACVILFPPDFLVSRTPPPLEGSDKESICVTDDRLKLGEYFIVIIGVGRLPIHFLLSLFFIFSFLFSNINWWSCGMTNGIIIFLLTTTNPLNLTTNSLIEERFCL